MPFNNNGGWYPNRNQNRRYGNRQAYYPSAYPQVPAKRSGCKEKQGKNGKSVIFGWRLSNRQFMTFVATQNNGEHAFAKGGAIIKNKKGQEYSRYTAKLVNKTIGSVATVSCLFNHTTGKLYFPDLDLVANPAKNYWGRASMNKRQ